MCVDDYQFRHHSALREKLCKRFIFCTPEGMDRVYLVNISQFQIFGKLCLCQILMHLNKKGLNIKDYRFYLPKFDTTIEAGDRCQIPFDLITDKEVVFQMKLIDDENLLRYRKLYDSCQRQKNALFEQEFAMEEEIEEEKSQKCDICEELRRESAGEQDQSEEQYSPGVNSPNCSKEEGNKKNKEAEKTVREALEKTKKWRWIHENLNFSLKNAANFVQVSKKTLDDYFLILRVGYFHRYDYKNNLDKKIGHLRGFIKNQPVKIRGRLPKVLGAFDLVPDPDISPISQMLAARLTKGQHIQIMATSQSLSTQSLRGRSDDHDMIAE